MKGHERSGFSPPVTSKPVHAGFNGGRLTSDAGVLVLAGIELRLIARAPASLPVSF